MASKRTTTRGGTRPTVTLLITPSSSHDRRTLDGINRFLAERGSWQVSFDPWRHYNQFPDAAALRSVDGLICQAGAQDVLERIGRLGLPTVVVGTSAPPSETCAVVTNDDEHVGQIVGKAFLDSGFETFAFAGESGRGFSDRRRQGFKRFLSEQDKGLHLIDLTRNERGAYRALLRGLKKLPKPAAVFAQNDQKGMLVLRACEELGLDVPEQVALIAVDDDELMCRLVRPSMSSVRLDAERLGELAAETLDAMLRGGVAPPERLIPPIGLMPRQTSDAMFESDPHLVRALRFIRDHAHEGIRVGDVLDDVPVSRRWLEHKFRERFGRAAGDSPADRTLAGIQETCGPDYAWPGNVRELEQCVRAHLIRHQYTPICQQNTPAPSPGGPADWQSLYDTADSPADTVLRRYARRVYQRAGTYTEAARLLDLDRRTVKRLVDVPDAD